MSPTAGEFPAQSIQMQRVNSAMGRLKHAGDGIRGNGGLGDEENVITPTPGMRRTGTTSNNGGSGSTATIGADAEDPESTNYSAADSDFEDSASIIEESMAEESMEEDIFSGDDSDNTLGGNSD